MAVLNKICVCCKKELDLSCFYKSTNNAGGLTTKCKSCISANYHKNSQEIRKKRVARYYAKQDVAIAYSRKWYSENKKKATSTAKNWVVTNRSKSNSIKAKYRQTKRMACPAWLTSSDLNTIVGIYEMSTRLSSCLQVKHHVDHIVPLQGKFVCGLHVPWNLRAIPQKHNLAKSNKLGFY